MVKGTDSNLEVVIAGLGYDDSQYRLSNTPDSFLSIKLKRSIVENNIIIII